MHLQRWFALQQIIPGSIRCDARNVTNNSATDCIRKMKMERNEISEVEWKAVRKYAYSKMESPFYYCYMCQKIGLGISLPFLLQPSTKLLKNCNTHPSNSYSNSHALNQIQLYSFVTYKSKLLVRNALLNLIFTRCTPFSRTRLWRQSHDNITVTYGVGWIWFKLKVLIQV